MKEREHMHDFKWGKMPVFNKPAGLNVNVSLFPLRKV